PRRWGGPASAWRSSAGKCGLGGGRWRSPSWPPHSWRWSSSCGAGASRMDPITVAVLGLAGMFVLIFLHVPLGVAMGVAGVVGFGVLAGFGPALTLLASETANQFSSLDLAAIPLFLMMGAFATVAGLSEDLYRIAYA